MRALRGALKPSEKWVNLSWTGQAFDQELASEMYVAEILERCRDLASRTAQVYRRLAQRFHGDPERVSLWRELALEEETHADILRRELESFQEQDQSGSFLPEYA